MSEIDKLRTALARIAKVASAAANGDEDDPLSGDEELDDAQSTDRIVCTPKFLPKKLRVKAAQTAREINPVNQPAFALLPSVAPGLDVTPEFIAAITTKYWGPSPRTLTVSFLDNPAADLRRRIIAHMNAWNQTANIRFVETRGTGQVRISRGQGGYYSYLGTDILHIPTNRQTMNLQGFTMSTRESEYKRVVRHETGHTLGFPHEHMRRALVARIDPEKAYEYFRRTQNPPWDRAMVDQQVLTPLDERTLMSTPADQTSIMCYQLPGSITRDGRPILGGVDINPTDYAFAGRIYPKPGHEPSSDPDDGWEEEDAAESLS